MDNYQLQVLIEGDESTLDVTIACTASIGTLRESIHRLGQLDSAGIRATKLKLLKVCHDQSQVA